MLARAGVPGPGVPAAPTPDPGTPLAGTAAPAQALRVAYRCQIAFASSLFTACHAFYFRGDLRECPALCWLGASHAGNTGTFSPELSTALGLNWKACNAFPQLSMLWIATLSVHHSNGSFKEMVLSEMAVRFFPPRGFHNRAENVLYV